jgi:hypothetical protein
MYCVNIHYKCTKITVLELCCEIIVKVIQFVKSAIQNISRFSLQSFYFIVSLIERRSSSHYVIASYIFIIVIVAVLLLIIFAQYLSLYYVNLLSRFK